MRIRALMTKRHHHDIILAYRDSAMYRKNTIWQKQAVSGTNVSPEDGISAIIDIKG